MSQRNEATGVSTAMSEGLRRLDDLQRELCAAALAEIGADGDMLTADERRRLDDDGFVILPDVLSLDHVQAINEHLDQVIQRTWQRAGGSLPRDMDPKCVILEHETVVKDLANRGPLFDIAFTHPKVMAAVAHVLRGDLKVTYLHMRQPSPGHGHQALHLDTYEIPAVHPVHYFCNSIWMLDDFTEDNGPTRFVPGTHRSLVQPVEAMTSYYDTHPDEVYAVGKAGSVIVFDGHVWHGGTANKRGLRRRGMFSAWVHRNFYQIDDQRKFLHPETYERLSDGARYLLDIHGAAQIETPE